jgi:ribonuclease BN (tRNA processing enzyme)
VKVTLIPSSVPFRGEDGGQFLTSYLVNGTLAIDAGALGLIEDIDTQAGVAHIFLSHAHLDHLATLPVFLDNVYQNRYATRFIYAGEATLDALRRDIFNDRVWPDHEILTKANPPFFRLVALEPGRPVAVDGLRVTPVPVDHAVPALGFLVEEPGSGVIFSGDTGPTEHLWQVANAAPDLKAVFLEASFPDRLSELATVARHLTPARFAAEVHKLRRPARIVAVHLKPQFYAELVSELTALGLPQLEIGRPGKTYSF